MTMHMLSLLWFIPFLQCSFSLEFGLIDILVKTAERQQISRNALQHHRTEHPINSARAISS